MVVCLRNVSNILKKELSRLQIKCRAWILIHVCVVYHTHTQPTNAMSIDECYAAHTHTLHRRFHILFRSLEHYFWNVFSYWCQTNPKLVSSPTTTSRSQNTHTSHQPPFNNYPRCLCTLLPLWVKPIICSNSNWNSIYINSSSSNPFMDGWWNDEMDRRKWDRDVEK